MRPWVGVDLDGTLARHEPSAEYDEQRIGEPVPAMVQRIKLWLESGLEVRIVTARVSNPYSTFERAAQVEGATNAIRAWCLEHLGRELPVTSAKDYGMVELWDDRCVQVIPNTGVPVGELYPIRSERELVALNLRAALAAAKGDKRAAARMVGISLKTIYNRLNEWPELGAPACKLDARKRRR